MYTDIIKNKLDALKVSYKKSGDHYLLSQCLNPHHSDEHGSFSINTQTGYCKCFTCGFTIGVDFFTNGVMSEEQEEEMKRQATYYKLKEQLKRESKGLCKFSGLPLKGGETPEGYRGFTKDTIKKFKLYECNVGRYANRTIFPFDSEGFTSRTHDKDSEVKYLHSKGFDNKHSLYPFDILKEARSDYVVVVEGIVDSISLWQDGIPSTCNFGISNNFSSYKIGKLLEIGVETIYIMMDNDEVGQKAEENLLEDYNLKEYFEVKSARELELLDEFYSSECKDYNEYMMKRGKI